MYQNHDDQNNCYSYMRGVAVKLPIAIDREFCPADSTMHHYNCFVFAESSLGCAVLNTSGIFLVLEKNKRPGFCYVFSVWFWSDIA